MKTTDETTPGETPKRRRATKPAVAVVEVAAETAPRRRTTRRKTEEAPVPVEAPAPVETEAPKKRAPRARKAAAEAPAEKVAKTQSVEKPAPVVAVAAPPPARPAVETPAPQTAPAAPAVAAPAPVQALAPGQQRPNVPGQPGQPGQPGEPGQGRRRRRRRRGRGGGGGQPGAPGQPGQPGQPAPQGQGGHAHGGQAQHVPHHQVSLEAQLQPFYGILEVEDRGHPKLHKPDRGFEKADGDPEVHRHIIDRYKLRPGQLIHAQVLTKGGKPTVHRIDLVEGVPPEEAAKRHLFANLTSVDPDRRIQLETTGGELLTRAIDLIAPIGFGQRALITAPPKAGKTIILQKIAKAVLENHPKAKLLVLLIDERPEEVTDFRRSIGGAEVYGSSSDRPAHEHLRIAELVTERARRMVEGGEDVVVLLDSITRLARAFNKEIEGSGRTMSGGVDSRAMERPKRIFGSARNTEEAGSLTIIGTALVETGSRMDDVIFEEFKGTGNMELVLDRQLAERRIFPAININASGTRKEEKFFDQRENDKIRKLRQFLASMRPAEAMEKLLSRLKDYRSNAEFLEAIG